MWRTADPTDPESTGARAARRITLAATVLFVLLLTRWHPWHLFDRAGFSTDFYDEQARAFLHGRLWVDPQVADIEGFLIDRRTYLYFGPFLALVRLPFALFGHVFDGRLVRLSMTIGFVVLCTGAYHLVVQARRWFGWSPSAWRTAGFVAAVATSPALYLAGWVSVYHETELWAATFALWAAVGTMRLLREPGRRAALLTAGSVAAALLTRASVGIGIAAGVGGVVLVALVRGRLPRPHALAVIGGCVAGFALHVAVNAAKFGSMLGLPAERQVLTLRDPERAAWFAGNDSSFFGLRFVGTTVVHYLRPDTIRFERVLPIVRYGPLATDRGSYPMETITPSASLTNAATVLLLAALVGVVVLLRRRGWAWLGITAGTALAAVPTFTIAFIGNRYLVDMLPMLAIPAAVAFAGAAPSLAAGRRRVVRVLLVAGVVWGAWVNTALAVWTSDLKEPGFTAWRYQVDDLFFGNPAPGLRLVGDGTVGRDGIVALDNDGDTCDGVYIAEQGRWVALERANGGSTLRGAVELDDVDSLATTPLVEGDGWRIDLVVAAGLARADLLRGDTGLQGVAVPVQRGRVRVAVVADPVMPELSVSIDGTLSLFSFDVPPDPPLATPAFTIDAGRGDSLCRQLAARR
jgi:hypothetical protein